MSLRILILDAPGVGGPLEGLADAIAAPLEVVVEPSPPIAGLADHLRGRGGIDVVVFGIGAGLTVDRDTFLTAATRAIDAAQAAGCRVLLVNGSTVVTPRDRDRSVAIAALNLAAVELSMQTGISVIDVDRAVAELGGDAHVNGVLSYSPEASAAIREELVRVLADYGFFDDRPLLEQVGQRGGT